MTGFNAISKYFQQPAPGDNARYEDILDGMAKLEREELAFAGLRRSFGMDLPEELPGTFPLSFHYPAPEGSKLVSFTNNGGQTLIGHPGGKRQHRHEIDICLVVNTRAGNNLLRLMNETLSWLFAYDLLYSLNPSLGGRVKAIGLTKAKFGPIDYQKKEYFGWTFRADCLAQYTFVAGPT